MFIKGSRYKKLNDIVVTDARGRSLASKCLRPQPDVTGTFLHTLEEVDRLDHLAFKYYRKPEKWWRICDANPGYLSPLALLGNEPIAVTGFSVTYNDKPSQPVWYKLLGRLGQIPGVKDASIEEKMDTEEITRVVTITYNALNISRGDLQKVLEEEGFGVDKDKFVETGRIGKKIIIPPDVVG